MMYNNLPYRYSYCHVFILALKIANKFNRKILYTPDFPENVTLKPSICGIQLQLRHFNAFVTDLANYDDLFRPVARRECVILVLLG